MVESGSQKNNFFVMQLRNNSDRSVVLEKIVQIWNKNKSFFVGTYLLAFVVHFYILSSYIPNHDDLAGIIANVDLTISGRWFSKYATRISSVYTMHAVNGTMSLVLLSVAIVLLINILGIKKKSYKILIAMLCVTFPTIAGILSYMQTADGYALSILLAVVGCYFLQRQSVQNFIGAVCCFTVSCGIYQAYITFSIGLIYIIILRKFLKQGKIERDLWRLILYSGSAIIISLLAYVGVLRIVLKISGQNLSIYSNINTMGQYTPKEMLGNFADAYRNFGSFFLGYKGIYSGVLVTANLAIVGFIVILLAFWGRRCSGIHKLYFLILILLLPVAFNSIELLKPAGNHCSILTTYALVLVYVLGICLLHDVGEKRNFSKMGGNLCIVLAMIVVIWNNYLLTNEIYMKLDLTWEKSKLWASRLLEDIQDVDGYQTNIPVMVDGLSSLNSDRQEDVVLDELDFLLLTDSYTFCVDSDEYNENLLFHYYKNLLDIEIIPASQEEKTLIRESVIYKRMPNYPNAGGVRMIGNVIVVKVGGS